MQLPLELRAGALSAICVKEPLAKVRAVEALTAASARVDPSAALQEPPGVPGRPDRPRLVRPAELPRRPVGTREGRAALLHSIAHIEFNAINLALDAIWRFPGLPENYYYDWLRVAAEEALHFSLLRERLIAHGVDYGDFDAHNGLWEMTQRTVDDPLARMALVPRTLEARGLDASPEIARKLAQAGDHASVEVIDIILRDEIGHVAIGNRWFRFLCQERSLDPHAAYLELCGRVGAPRLRGPFNLAARRAAGFDEAEIAFLQSFDERTSGSPRSP
jgi:uncharacterized ferritin-like protein (DUF455 family)